MASYIEIVIWKLVEILKFTEVCVCRLDFWMSDAGCHLCTYQSDIASKVWTSSIWCINLRDWKFIFWKCHNFLTKLSTVFKQTYLWYDELHIWWYWPNIILKLNQAPLKLPERHNNNMRGLILDLKDAFGTPVASWWLKYNLICFVLQFNSCGEGTSKLIE